MHTSVGIFILVALGMLRAFMRKRTSSETRREYRVALDKARVSVKKKQGLVRSRCKDGIYGTLPVSSIQLPFT